MKIRFLPLFVIGSLLLSACGSSQQSMDIASIDLSPQSLTITKIGGASTLQATAKDKDNNPVSSLSSFGWASSNNSVATVDASGRVTAVGNGQATISATLSQSAGSAAVIVDDSRFIELSPTELYLTAIGGTVAVQAVVKDILDVPVIEDYGLKWGSSDPTVATVDPSGLVTAVSYGEALITATFSDGSGSASTRVYVDDRGYTLTGQVLYQDKNYGTLGFTDYEPYKPVRYAQVQLIENTSGSEVQAVSTDQQGRFSFISPFPRANYYLRVLAQTDTALPNGIDIQVSTLAGERYAATQSVDFGVNSTTALVMDMTIPTTNFVAGVFNMLDVFTSGVEFVLSLGGSQTRALNVYWAPNNSLGSYTCWSGFDSSCTQGEGIYVLGSSVGDSDEYDDDVLWHEFGHFIEMMLGLDDSPGGGHWYEQTTQDLRLAWSEGFASYISSAIKGWLQKTNPTRLSTTLAPSIYIDTDGGFVINRYRGICFDFSLPNVCGASSADGRLNYSSSEVAVANVLLGFDSEIGGTQSIWNVVSGYMPFSPYKNSLESFWDGWASQSDSYRQLLRSRKIYYEEDVVEIEENGLGRAVMDCTRTPAGESCVSETRYFYRDDKTKDVDYVEVRVSAGRTYKFETLALTNGADTVLTLSGGADANLPLTNNDQYNFSCPGAWAPNNTSTAFSSGLSYTPQVDGVLRVEVTIAPDVCAGSGRYGTYTLRVSRQN